MQQPGDINFRYCRTSDVIRANNPWILTFIVKPYPPTQGLGYGTLKRKYMVKVFLWRDLGRTRWSQKFHVHFRHSCIISIKYVDREFNWSQVTPPEVLHNTGVPCMVAAVALATWGSTPNSNIKGLRSQVCSYPWDLTPKHPCSMRTKCLCQ